MVDPFRVWVSNLAPSSSHGLTPVATLSPSLRDDVALEVDPVEQTLSFLDGPV